METFDFKGRTAVIIVAAIEKRRPRVPAGHDARIAALVERQMPTACWSLPGRNR